MKIKSFAMALLLGAASFGSANAQSTYENLELLTVNQDVTTVVTASEPIRFVDISTDKVAGDQPINNTLRLKPKDGEHQDGDVLAVVTVVTERYRTQYGLIYTSQMSEAVTDKTIELHERIAYHNPAVSMSTEDMYRFARRIWNSTPKSRKVKIKKHKLQMKLNNVYAVGEYFFIDFSLENTSNIRFDIDQLRVSLNDRKVHRATNTQSIELKPELILDRSTSFFKGYRNVIVLKKLTFPDDKVLTIELSEKQISGRTLNLSINYNDVLNADSFSESLLTKN